MMKTIKPMRRRTHKGIDNRITTAMTKPMKVRLGAGGPTKIPGSSRVVWGLIRPEMYVPTVPMPGQMAPTMCRGPSRANQTG